MNRRLLLAASALAASVACKQPAAPAPAPASADRPSDNKPQAAAVATPPGRSDERCVAPLDTPTSSFSLRPKRGKLVLGVFSGLKDATTENLVHLRALIDEVKKRGAEILIADGDLGDSPEEQELLLGALVQSGLPVLATASNREVRTDLDAAELALQKRGAVLFDLSHTRVVDLGDVLAVGLPGAYDRRQLHAEGGCVYVQRDLDALDRWIAKLPPSAPPVLLIAAVPPKGQDARALDASDGQNLGDARLLPLLQTRRAAFGVFGQVWEAGGRAIDGTGKPIPQGQAAEQLYLNPGAAELTPWPMADGTTSTGQAAVLTIEGRRAAFEVVRRPPPPKAAATGDRAG